jgi:cytochrome c
MPNKVAGAAISAELMAQWKAKNPNREWDTNPDPPHAIVAGADNSGVVANESNQGSQQTYGRYTARDVLTWKREVDRAVEEGDQVFHDADRLGSTIAVSCDMCHPHAANTHPETYPKYQVQLGRVALLRDMINWCLQHPVRAEPMQADDPRMRAMEAYIYAQRRGVSLDYGRK